MVRIGISLHDEGDYQGALELFEQAQKLDPSSALVQYELANTYFILKGYDQDINFSQKVIGSKSEFADQAYVIYGVPR